MAFTSYGQDSRKTGTRVDNAAITTRHAEGPVTGHHPGPQSIPCVDAQQVIHAPKSTNNPSSHRKNRHRISRLSSKTLLKSDFGEIKPAAAALLRPIASYAQKSSKTRRELLASP